MASLDRARYCRPPSQSLRVMALVLAALSPYQKMVFRARINPLRLHPSGIRTRPLGWGLPRHGCLSYQLAPTGEKPVDAETGAL